MPNVKSNWFRVAVAGATADGRIIQDEWLEQAAQNYNRQYYGARIWPEHIRGLVPGNEFKAQGDVLELKTQVDKINGEDRLCLYARIEPLPSLVDMVGAGEKIYTSVEIMESFADTNEAYMVGLAVTDSPASVGTEVLTFSAQHRGVQITDSIETSLKFSKEGKLKKMFNQIRKPFNTEGGDGGATGDTPPADDLETRLAKIESRLDALEKLKEEVKEEVQEEIQELEDKVEKIEEEVKEAQEEYKRLSMTDPNGTHRPAATGGNGFTMTNY